MEGITKEMLEMIEHELCNEPNCATCHLKRWVRVSSFNGTNPVQMLQLLTSAASDVAEALARNSEVVMMPKKEAKQSKKDMH